MNPTSRLGRQLAEILLSLQRIDVPTALIGGLALSAYKVIRATQDIDLLIDQKDSDKVHEEVARLGYRCLYRTDNVANYQRQDERLDFLYAARPIAKRLLASAIEAKTSLAAVRVITAEGLIGFKLQGVANDPRRSQDLEDIKSLLRANSDSLNMGEVREYFQLFEREALLDELLR
jgi:hypothetical protein